MFDVMLEGLVGYLFVVQVGEQYVVGLFVEQVVVGFVQVVFELVDGFFVEWYQVFFVVFVEYFDYVLVQVDLFQGQVDQFVDLQVVGIQYFEYGVIVQVQWVVDFWCCQ